MDRIGVICSLIDDCESFADVGCDHGYCTKYALENNKCRRAVISDISAKSLRKAETLLQSYIKSGACRAVCCDGLSQIDGECEQVLIAGMGGNEIIKILKNAYVPKKFIFQPMKSARLLRSYLLERGCRITADDIFKDDKYYFVIKGEREGGTSAYSEAELRFGRDSIKNPIFADYAREELEKKLGYIKGCRQDSDAAEIREEIRLLTELVK